MSTAANFEEYDYAIVDAAILGVDPEDVQELVGAGFVPPLESNELAFEELFEPSSTPGAPRIFLRWSVEYTSVDGVLEDIAVDRTGTVEIHVFGQYGVSAVLLGKAASLYVAALKAASNETAIAFIDAIPPVSLEPVGGFSRRRYGVTFNGVG